MVVCNCREALAPHVLPARVGLVLIGATQEGFALAADGSSLNADGRVSQEQKLFQAGKNGVVAISGSVSIQDPVGKRVRDEVNIAASTGAWLAAHPEADIQTVDREVNAAVSAAVNKFLSTRDPGAERGVFKFAIAAAGLVEGKPTVMVTRYFLPSVKGKALRAERTLRPPKLENCGSWQFSVPMELLTGRSNCWQRQRLIQRLKVSFLAQLNSARQDTSICLIGSLTPLNPTRAGRWMASAPSLLRPIAMQRSQQKTVSPGARPTRK